MRKFSEIQKIRHKKLREIIDPKPHGEQKRLADLLGQEPNYTAQFAGKKPIRPISENMARKIEEAYGLPKFFLEGSADDKRKDGININRMTLAIKYANKMERFLKYEPNEEQKARFVVDFYEGTVQKPKDYLIPESDPHKARMVSVGLLARELLDKALSEPGINLTPEEQNEIYASIFNDLYENLQHNGGSKELTNNN